MISDAYYTCHACGSSNIELIPRDSFAESTEDDDVELENYYECQDCGDNDIVA